MPTTHKPDRHSIVGWGDPAPVYSAHARMESIDLFRAMMAGALPHEPAMAMLGARVTGVERGEVTLMLDPAEHHSDPTGCVHGGILAAITDTAAGYAIHSRLPLGASAATLELHQTFVRPVTARSGRIRCVGRVIHLGRRTAVAEAVITDAEGRICVQMGTTMIVRPPPDASTNRRINK